MAIYSPCNREIEASKIIYLLSLLSLSSPGSREGYNLRYWKTRQETTSFVVEGRLPAITTPLTSVNENDAREE